MNLRDYWSFSRAKLGLATAVALAMAVLGCSKPASALPPKTFTINYSSNVTPLDHASERYSDFKYELRKPGEAKFNTYSPASVTKTADGAVEARFLITIPEPQADEKYQIRTSYSLDGKLYQDGIREMVFIATAKKD
jgi:hypothetical protein